MENGNNENDKLDNEELRAKLSQAAEFNRQLVKELVSTRKALKDLQQQINTFKTSANRRITAALKL